jgi:hypothetical protein
MRLTQGKRSRNTGVGVTHQPNCDILRTLAIDKHEDARGGVAANPATPAGIFRSHASDRHWKVHRDLSTNPATPVDVLPTLATDADKDVRERISTGPVAVPSGTSRSTSTSSGIRATRSSYGERS